MNDFADPASGLGTRRDAPTDDPDFELCYQQWREPLVRFCARLLRGHGDAESVAQEAFLRAWASWSRYTQDRPFWPWVATIARRLCVNELHAEIRHDQRLIGAGVRYAASVNEDFDEQSADAATVRQVLGQLGARERRLLVLRDVEGWSYDDIARFEGVTRESVRGSLKRARCAFRKVYGRLGGSALGGFGALRHLVSWRPRWARAVDTGHRWAALPWPSPEKLAALAGVLLVAGTAGTGLPAVGPMSTSVVESAAATPATEDVSAAPARQEAVKPAVSASSRDEHVAPFLPSSSPPPSGTASDDALTPGDGRGYDFAPSPAYRDDGTVFAMGQTNRCPVTSPCPALFKSTDGGASWTPLAAQGLPAGMSYTVLLPPAFPRDGRIFAVSPAALFVSHDGGEQFELVTPVPGYAAMSPLFSVDDPRIVFGAPKAALYGLQVPTQYRDDTGAVSPLVLPLPAHATPVWFHFSPTYAEDRRMLVTVLEKDLARPSVDLLAREAVYLCSPSSCARVIDEPGQSPTVAWSTATPGTVFVRSSWALHRSTDGGRTFTAMARPGSSSEVLNHLAVGPTGRVYASMLRLPQDRDLYASDDAGETWTRLGPNGVSTSDGFVELADGAVLAENRDGGIRCSVDGARTWSDRCERLAA